MATDKELLRDLIQMKPETIHRVFFKTNGDYRSCMEMAITDCWQVNNEDNTIPLLSFLQYLTNNGCTILNQMYQSCCSGTPFYKLLITRFVFFLSEHQDYKKQRQDLFKTLFANTVPAGPETTLELKEKNALNDFLWGNGTLYDEEINTVTKSLQEKFPQLASLDVKTVKKELHDALCIHPEMVLFSYDFSDTLNNWRAKTAGRIIRQIGDLQIIKSLLERDPRVIKKVFYSDGSDYKIGIETAIRESWDLNETEKILAIVMTFVYFLLKGKGAELRQLKQGIARNVPYFLPQKIKIPSSISFPEEWERYESGELCSLLQRYAMCYADERKKHKDERVKLQNLFNLSEEERNRLWTDYEKQINEAIKTINTRYKLSITDNIKEAVRKGLQQSLCNDIEHTFARYDFKQAFTQWKNTFTKHYIEDFIKVQCMCMGDGSWIYKILKTDHVSFINKYIDDENSINDIINDIFLRFFENKKDLEAFQYDSRLNTYINGIVKYYISHIKKDIVPDPCTGPIDDENNEYPDLIFNPIAIRDWQEKQRLDEVQFPITPDNKEQICHALIEILKTPRHSEYLKIKINNVNARRLELWETLFQQEKENNLHKLSSGEQKKRREDDKTDLIELYASYGASYNENLKNQDKCRAIKMIKVAHEKVDKICKKHEHNEQLSPEETAILNDFQNLLKNIF